MIILLIRKMESRTYQDISTNEIKTSLPNSPGIPYKDDDLSVWRDERHHAYDLSMDLHDSDDKQLAWENCLTECFNINPERCYKMENAYRECECLVWFFNFIPTTLGGILFASRLNI